MRAVKNKLRSLHPLSPLLTRAQALATERWLAVVSADSLQLAGRVVPSKLEGCPWALGSRGPI